MPQIEQYIAILYYYPHCVVVCGFRPNALDKYGLGRDDILRLCKDRKRGIIYARLTAMAGMVPGQTEVVEAAD